FDGCLYGAGRCWYKCAVGHAVLTHAKCRNVTICCRQALHRVAGWRTSIAGVAVETEEVIIAARAWYKSIVLNVRIVAAERVESIAIILWLINHQLQIGAGALRHMRAWDKPSAQIAVDSVETRAALAVDHACANLRA